MIKIDVPGAELLGIEGAQHCLRRFRLDIVMEVSSGCSPIGADAKRTIALIENNDYAVFELKACAVRQRLRLSDAAAGFSAPNLFCTKRR